MGAYTSARRWRDCSSTGGVRKLRWAPSGRGKRGGLRVIYYWKNKEGEIWLLTIYDKTEREHPEPRFEGFERGAFTMTKRNIGEEILEGVRAIKRGEGQKREMSEPDIKAVRDKSGLSQSAFAALLGVSLRTLQEWEQGRRRPTGPARSLLKIADKHPEVLKN